MATIFADDIFERIFLDKNLRVLIDISLRFSCKGPISHNPLLVKINGWRRTGYKPVRRQNFSWYSLVQFMASWHQSQAISCPIAAKLLIGLFGKFLRWNRNKTTKFYLKKTRFRNACCYPIDLGLNVLNVYEKPFNAMHWQPPEIHELLRFHRQKIDKVE